MAATRNSHGLPAPWQQLDLAWTHVRFKNKESDDISVGRFIPNSVDQVITGRCISSGPLSADNSVRSKSSLIANLRLNRKLGAKLELSLDALNHFDRRYKDIESFYAFQLKSVTAPVSAKLVHPGAPRSLRLTLKAQF